MARAKARADGLIERTKTYDGKRVHFYGKTAKEVAAKIEEYERQREEMKENGPLFEDVAGEWWETHSKNIKTGAERAYKGSYKAALEEFSGYRMKEITPAVVSLWGEKFKAAGYAGKTASNARSVLSCVFKFWCVRDGETYNPVTVTDLPRGMKKERREPPTVEQLETVKAHPEGFGLCAWLFMYTGCRLGEVLALQWGDVDFENNKIVVNKEVAWVNAKPVVQTPKTANGVRVVPLLTPLRAVLEPLKGGKNDFILGGKKPLKSYEYHNNWLRYCVAVGMAEIDTKAEAARERKRAAATGGAERKKRCNTHCYKASVTAHQFRHEYASMLYAAGIGEMEAQKLMGHADISTTRKVYTHIRERQLNGAAEALEKFINDNPK